MCIFIVINTEHQSYRLHHFKEYGLTVFAMLSLVVPQRVRRKYHMAQHFMSFFLARCMYFDSL